MKPLADSWLEDMTCLFLTEIDFKRVFLLILFSCSRNTAFFSMLSVDCYVDAIFAMPLITDLKSALVNHQPKPGQAL